MESTFVPSWAEALHFMVGPGAAVASGVVISILIGYWAWFEALEEKHKVAVYVGLCVLVPLVATALAIATRTWGTWLDVAGTWWPAIWAGFTAAGFGTLFHAWKPSQLK